jgi:glycosyltransferase involved in cell wall biosynthesis
MSEPREIEVSVVMPCLNEAKTLPGCIKKALACFEEHNLRGEIIVADNGSTDGSPQIARALGAIVVEQPIKGYGAALRKGFEASRGQFIVMGDADDSYDFGETYRLIEHLRRGSDIVMGSRQAGKYMPGASPWLHVHVGVPIMTWMLNWLFHTSISDSHCGLRGFRGEILDRLDLRATGMELASEMLIKAAKAGLKITEIPITLYPDKRDRPPHLRSFQDGWRHLRLMLLFAPETLYFLPGICLTVLGGILLVTIALMGRLPLTSSIALGENSMIMGMIMVFLGVQILYLGMFSKLFTFCEFHLKDSRWIEFLLNVSRLEVGLVVGLILAAIGFFGLGMLIRTWAQTNFSRLDLSSIRHSLFFATFLMVGLQITFSSFFFAMIGIDRETYIGHRKMITNHKGFPGYSPKEGSIKQGPPPAV